MKHDITIRGLRKSFPEFLLDVDFTIHPHEMMTIVGPSGCGKSTTLSLITGLLSPDSGILVMDEKDVTNLPVWERKIGVVFQDYALFPHMNVAQNIGYGLKIQHQDKAMIANTVRRLLSTIQLDGYEQRAIDNLSGGERQRVALARALAPGPKLLLLDEPLSALDAKLRIQLRKEIQRIHHELGLTTLYVTHDQAEALAISDRIIVMNHGTIEQIGTPEEIYDKPASLFVAQFIGISNILPFTSATDSSIQIGSSTAKPSYVSFRPEYVTIGKKLTNHQSQYLIFEDARLVYQEFAGHHYICTFTHHDHELHAYAARKLSQQNRYVLTVEKKNVQTIV